MCENLLPTLSFRVLHFQQDHPDGNSKQYDHWSVTYTRSVPPSEPEKWLKNGRRHATVSQCCQHYQANARHIPTNTRTKPKIINTELTKHQSRIWTNCITAVMQMRYLWNPKNICESQKHFLEHQDISPDKGWMGTLVCWYTHTHTNRLRGCWDMSDSKHWAVLQVR